MANPIRPAVIDHIVLRVVDIEAMTLFYVDVLGCTPEREVKEIGLFQFRVGSSLIDLVPVTGKLGAGGGEAPDPNARNLDHFCLTLKEFDEAKIREHLTRHGVEASPAGNRYGATGFGTSIYIRDPEGNGIELKA
tara:strand:+ start:50 stop:454 length:405 start_codon:yes stop_codon:yes gene_type:complete